jgi:sn-glycerol 3-phosphate transport system permease protein
MAADLAPRGWRLGARYALLAVVTVLVLFPVYTTVIGAFKPTGKLLDNPLLPDAFTLDVLADAWTDGRLGRYLFNSFVVAAIVTVCQVVTSLLSGYAFSLLDFPGRGALFVVFLSTMLVPLEATLVVNRRTIGDLGWLNSYQGLAIPFAATAFGTFLVRQAFLSLPPDLRDAAIIDGAGHLAFLRHVAVPVVRPTLGALALFSFLSSWNQYLWPNLVTTEADMNTVQSGLRSLREGALQQPNLVMAGTVIAAIPIAIALLVFQKALVRGLTAGAVKG